MLETLARNFWTFIAVIVFAVLILIGLAVDIYFRYGPRDPKEDSSFKHFKKRMKDKYDDPCDRIYD